MANLFGSVFDKNYEIELKPIDIKIVIIKNQDIGSNKVMARCIDYELVGEGLDEKEAFENLAKKVLGKIVLEWEQKKKPLSTIDKSKEGVTEWASTLPKENLYWLTVWKIKPNQKASEQTKNYKLWN